MQPNSTRPKSIKPKSTNPAAKSVDRLFALFSLLMCGIFCGLFCGCQSEVAKWEFARGMLEADAGETDAAIDRMRAAVAKAPNDPLLKLEFAKILAEQGDEQAIALCDEVAKEFPNRKLIQLRKIECLQALGEFEKALAAYKDFLSDHIQRDQTERNNLAYFRSLANCELRLASNDIDLAIAAEDQIRWESDLFLPMPVKSVMATGIIARHFAQKDSVDSPAQFAGDQTESDINFLQIAIKDLDTVIADFDAELARIEFLVDKPEPEDFDVGFLKRMPDELSATSSKQMNAFDTEPNQESRNRAEQNMHLLRGCLASMLVVRALLQQDSGNDQECNADRYRVDQLGFDADKLAKELPGKMVCLDMLRIASTYLDTRGYIRALLPWDDDPAASDVDPDKEETSGTDPDEESKSKPPIPDPISNYKAAISDLDLAYQSARFHRVAIEKSFYNLPELSADNVHELLKQAKRTEAVLLFHRTVAQQRQGDDDAAEEDRNQIKKLGFDPDTGLY